MTQDECWLAKCIEVKTFIEVNKRNPSRYDDEVRGLYVNWLKHNRKLYAAGEMKKDRMMMFEELLGLMEENKRVNQYR